MPESDRDCLTENNAERFLRFLSQAIVLKINALYVSRRLRKAGDWSFYIKDKHMSYVRYAAVPLLLLACQAGAAEAGYFAGIGLSTSVSGKAEAELENADVTLSEDIDVGALNLFIGHRSVRNNRFIFSYDSISFDLDSSNTSEDATGFRFDWQFVYGEEQVQPYWGLGFGLYNLQDATILNGSNLEGDDMSGISFQMAVGAKIDVADNVELDVSLQRQAIAWQEIEFSGFGRTETIQMSYAYNLLSAGVAFKF